VALRAFLWDFFGDQGLVETGLPVRMHCIRLQISGQCVRRVCRRACFSESFTILISHQVLLKSFCKSQSQHKSGNLFFMLLAIVKNKLNLWGVDFCKTTSIFFV